ncbi:unnamed protein product [Miscanthus lutarioriparius]|uniref:Uncharacterized protein n=1 Tax=Miscanthus lutarioriparius TaxID=422564 RepID=A0A811SN66_9POAL|nr:unnamed protein product [Miscanthus lutarioriparius]
MREEIISEDLMSTQSRWRGCLSIWIWIMGELQDATMSDEDAGDRMEYLCATSTAGAMAVIAVVGSHRAPRSPAGHMNVWLLGLTDIGPDRQGQSRHLRLADPAPTLQVCFVNTLRPASGGVRVAPMGAGWCRAGGVRGAAPVGLRTERAVFFGETRADWN